MTSSETTFNDEELIARLRLYGSKFHHEFGHNNAADRIEQLAVRKKALTKERDAYARKLMQANNTYAEMHLEIERLSDKLAKTEGLLAMAMHVIKGRIHWEASGLTCGCGECQALVATVAQIEGKSND